MNEKFVFEVREVQERNGDWEIGGLAFSVIKLGDVLSTNEQSESVADRLYIKDIITYERHVEELVRGLTGRVIVERNKEIDLTDVKYLYMAQPSQ